MPRRSVLVIAVFGLVAGCSGEVGGGSTGGAGEDGNAGSGGASSTGIAGGPSVGGEGGSVSSGTAGSGGSNVGVAGSGGRAAGSGGHPAGSGGGGTAGAPQASGGAGVAGSGSVAGSNGGSGAAGKGGSNASAKGGSTGKGGTSGGAGASVGGGAGTAAQGGSSGGSSAGSSGTGDPPGYVPGLIGVGYGGLRIVSRDGGKTWGSRAYSASGTGDDEHLLRAITYGKGLWIATGWKFMTSTDGVHWTDYGLIEDGAKARMGTCNIVEGLAYNAGNYYAACSSWAGNGQVFKSSDGLTWTKIGTIGDTGNHVSLTYRAGKFVAYGDTGISFQSTDALTWTVMSGITGATYCLDSFRSKTECKDSSWYDGAFLRLDWPGHISRSTDGKTFTVVYNDDQENSLYQSRAMAAGYVAP